jgi:hypothetical protein
MRQARIAPQPNPTAPREPNWKDPGEILPPPTHQLLECSKFEEEPASSSPSVHAYMRICDKHQHRYRLSYDKNYHMSQPHQARDMPSLEWTEKQHWLKERQRRGVTTPRRVLLNASPVADAVVLSPDS